MNDGPINLFKSLSEELDPEILQRKFLSSLLELQGVDRGSIWIKKRNEYLCTEAVGRQSESIKGVSISAEHQSIVGWVIENGEMTISTPESDRRHYKEFEANLPVKSKLILCFPLFLKDGNVYGAIC